MSTKKKVAYHKIYDIVNFMRVQGVAPSLKSLDLKLSQFSLGEVTSIPQAIEFLNESIFEGGKQFRPQLIFRIGQILNIPSKDLQKYAVAAERIHCASLLHDDVIDESTERRGRPTINSSGENRKAIIAGDFLLAKTLFDLGTLPESSEILKHLFKVLVDLSEGEWLQIEARGIIPVEERHLREVASKKTASLIAWCLSTPARLAKFSETSVDLFMRAGIHLGIAFQMLDDCLDFDSKSGKPFSQDLFEGQVNFVIANLIEKDPSKVHFFQDVLYHRLNEQCFFPIKEQLNTSIDQVRKSAELEIVTALNFVKSTGVSKKTFEDLEKNIFQPFLMKTRERKIN